jgi:cytochrome c553
VPIAQIAPKALAAWLKTAPLRLKRWVRAMNFEADSGAALALPAPDGRIARVLFAQAKESSPWDYAQLPAKLPPGTYRLEIEPGKIAADAAAVARGRTASQPCVVCHGASGKGDMSKGVPDLTGQPAAYLRSQMLLFKADRRSPGDESLKALKTLMKSIPDEQFADLAAYFSSLR